MTKEIAIEQWTKLLERGTRLLETKVSTPEVERWKDNVKTAIVRTLPGRPDLLAKFDGIRNQPATVHRTDLGKQQEAHRRALESMLVFVHARLDEVEQYGIHEQPELPKPGVGPNPKRVLLIDVREQGEEIRDRLVRLGITPMEWSAMSRDVGHLKPSVRETITLGAKRAAAIVVVLAGDVALEAGVAIGMHPERTVLVAIEDSFTDPDLGGQPVVGLDGLAEALKRAGCEVSPSGDLAIPS